MPTAAEIRTCKRKIKYSDKQDAKQSAKKMTSKTHRRITYYECPVCGLYHLTKLINKRRKRKPSGFKVYKST